MKIRYSPKAARDLASIQTYISNRSPKGSLSVMTAIYGAIEFIRQNPEAAEETRVSGVRGKIVLRYNFKIFYRLITSEEVVEIVHVRHTSRRPWSGEDD